MPISLNSPITVVLDKLQIDEFTVRPQQRHVVIHFSRGYVDAEGNFVSKEFDRVDLKNVDIDPTLYSNTKDALYALLISALEQR